MDTMTEEAIDLNLSDLTMTEAEELLAKMPEGRSAGRPPGPRQYNRKNQLQEIWGRHKEIIRMHILGFKSVAIAKELNVTPQSISHVLNSAITKTRVDELQNLADENAVDMNKRFRESASDAQDLLVAVMEDKDEDIKTRVKVAMDQLDRGGHAPIRKIEGKHLLGIFDASDIGDMARDADEIKRLRDEAIVVVQENGNLADGDLNGSKK